MPEKKGYLWDPMYGILPDVDPIYYDDSLTEPAVVSAPLPAKFNGSQEAARRYAEGYRWGRENVRDPREQVAPYVGAGLAATMLAPYAIGAAATGATNPWAMQFGKRMLLDLPAFEVMDRLPTLIGQDRATVQAGNLAERGFRALSPDGRFEENVAPYVNQAGQFVGGFVPGMMGDVMMRSGVGYVNSALEQARNAARSNYGVDLDLMPMAREAGMDKMALRDVADQKRAEFKRLFPLEQLSDIQAGRTGGIGGTYQARMETWLRNNERLLNAGYEPGDPDYLNIAEGRRLINERLRGREDTTTYRRYTDPVELSEPNNYRSMGLASTLGQQPSITPTDIRVLGSDYLNPEDLQFDLDIADAATAQRRTRWARNRDNLAFNEDGSVMRNSAGQPMSYLDAEAQGRSPRSLEEIERLGREQNVGTDTDIDAMLVHNTERPDDVEGMPMIFDPATGELYMDLPAVRRFVLGHSAEAPSASPIEPELVEAEINLGNAIRNGMSVDEVERQFNPSFEEIFDIVGDGATTENNPYLARAIERYKDIHRRDSFNDLLKQYGDYYQVNGHTDNSSSYTTDYLNNVTEELAKQDIDALAKGEGSEMIKKLYNEYYSDYDISDPLIRERLAFLIRRSGKMRPDKLAKASEQELSEIEYLNSLKNMALQDSALKEQYAKKNPDQSAYKIGANTPTGADAHMAKAVRDLLDEKANELGLEYFDADKLFSPGSEEYVKMLEELRDKADVFALPTDPQHLMWFKVRDAMRGVEKATADLNSLNAPEDAAEILRREHVKKLLNTLVPQAEKETALQTEFLMRDIPRGNAMAEQSTSPDSKRVQVAGAARNYGYGPGQVSIKQTGDNVRGNSLQKDRLVVNEVEPGRFVVQAAVPTSYGPAGTEIYVPKKGMQKVMDAMNEGSVEGLLQDKEARQALERLHEILQIQMRGTFTGTNSRYKAINRNNNEGLRLIPDQSYPDNLEDALKDPRFLEALRFMLISNGDPTGGYAPYMIRPKEIYIKHKYGGLLNRLRSRYGSDDKVLEAVRKFKKGGDKATLNHPKYNAAKEKPMYDYLRYRGLGAPQASGMLGNLAVESWLNADLQQQGGGPAYGLMQAEANRQTAMKNYDGTVYQFGSNLSPEEQQQLDYIIDKGVDVYTPGEWGRKNFKGARDARAAFINADDVRTASDIVTNNFLRPGKPHIDRRRAMSEYYYDKYNSEAPYGEGFLWGNAPGFDFSAGGKIHIKPENRGKFTALKKRTGHSASWFKAHGTPAQKKMAVFELNARKWRHGDGGIIDRMNQHYNGDTKAMLELIRKVKNG